MEGHASAAALEDGIKHRLAGIAAKMSARRAAGRPAPASPFLNAALGYDAPQPARPKRMHHDPAEADPGPAGYRGGYRRRDVALPGLNSPPVKSRTEGGLDRAIAHEERD